MRFRDLFHSGMLCVAFLLGGQAAIAGGPSTAPLLLAQSESPQRPPDVPFVATPGEVVDQMLRLGKVGRNDVLYDLGSGDGRIVIAAAKRFGTRGLGVDIDPVRVREARENATKEGVADKVKFVQQDLFHTDLSQATVVTLYLLPKINLKLRPKLQRELKPGARVVSHNYDMGDWKPDQVVEVGNHTVYLWVIRDQAQGERAARD
jgi:SAM-dependent methyltransferase